MENGKQRKVCIIDDDPDLRDIYGRVFRREGFEVLVAENGEVGLKCVRESRPDAIILDLQMPIKGGFEVLRELRMDAALAAIPVVILSNVDDEKAFSEAEGSQSCYYLLKVMTPPQKAVDIVLEALRDKKD